MSNNAGETRRLLPVNVDIFVKLLGSHVALAFRVGKHGIEAFEREIRAYAYALLNSSKVSQGVRTRFALGHDLPDLESWSQEQREDALEALRSVLGVGLIQNDVRDCNFVHIDFEDSSIILDSSSSR